jgi:hypothetical protein
MVRLIGKGHTWYCAALAVLLIAALFCGCAGDADNSVNNDIKTPGESSIGTGGGNFPGLDAPLNVQYIRAAYIYDADAGWPIKPSATIVSSKEDLEQYYEKHKNRIWDGYGNEMPDKNFLGAIERYSDEYFADNFLVIVDLVEGSGSVRHKVERIDENGNIVINRLLPGVGTDDMAAWSILIELDNNFKEEQFRVVLSDVRDYQ